MVAGLQFNVRSARRFPPSNHKIPGESAPPPTSADLARYFPELEILELIGRGGMGAVYKARQKQLDRLVALKVLPSSVSRDPAFAERFARESRALARLTHPNIVTVHNSGQTDGLFYFVMEFVDGMNLRQLLNTGKIAPEEALAIVPQICDALQYAHDKGIVHRDIKPENILLDKAGTVKIADFGLAKLVGLEAKDLRITGSGDVMGTPHYMAPEQVEHPQDVDHRADIYSLGVVFYQMLTGELPIGRFAPPSRKVQIDVRLDEVVLRALEKEPELRYQHASEVKTQVETIATTQPVSATASAPLNPWQPVLLLLAALISSWVLLATTVLPRPLDWIAILFGSFGLVVSLLELVGLWPFPSPVFPESNFTRRNLPLLSRRPITLATVVFIGAAVVFGSLGVYYFHPIKSDYIKSDYIGQAWLPKGDLIEITSVVRTADRMSVRGRYQLLSHDAALLALYMTSTKSAGPEEARQRMQISKGTGYFDLVHTHLAPGLPHVSMYADDGHPFAALYFGTKAEALEESQAGWITNAPSAEAETSSEAMSAVNSWLALMDNGEYARGWDTAAPYFQAVMAKDEWIARLQKVRYPLWKVISRQFRSSRFTIPGTWLEVKFDTSFDGLPAATEIVTFAKQSGGEWQAIGYLILPAGGNEGWERLKADAYLDLALFVGLLVTVVLIIRPGGCAAKERPKTFASLALGLFLVGVLGTVVLMVFSRNDALPFIFGGIALMLALVFGAISWRERLGKGIVISTLVLCAVIAIAVGILSGVIPDPFRAQRRALAEEQLRQQTEKRMSELMAQQQVLAEFDWSKLAAEGRVLGGVPVTVDGRSALKIENTNDAPLQLSLFTIENPPITAMKYAVTGEIKYENVEGDGYLEMWNDFAAAGRFFSRTLGPAGSDPMGKITGTSTWRTFLLPFNLTGTTNAPTRLEINIFLPGHGVVFLGSMNLVQPVSATGAEHAISSRTFSLRHQPASEMASDLRQILLDHPGQEAKSSADNIQLTVVAPPDVLNRVATFIAVKDWPQGVTRGPECVYARDTLENAARSFFYACSIEDFYCISNLLSVDVLAKLKGTKLPPYGSAVDPRLIAELRGDWTGKEAAMRKLVNAWNQYPLRQLRAENRVAMGFGKRYFASASFEGSPRDIVQLDFTHDRNGTSTNALVIDTLPPWLPRSGERTR